MNLNPNEYRCAECEGVFEKGWSEEEAKAEAAKNRFDAFPQEEMVIVCDDCYKKIMRQLP
jgi:uncharacterized protein with PIN domain